MSVKIDSVSFIRTTVPALLTFARKVYTKVEKSGIELEQCAKLRSAYQAFSENFHVTAVKYGDTLSEIDNNVDLFWRSGRAILKVNLKHPEEEIRSLSTELYNVYQTYGDPTHMSYQKQYGVIDALLCKLKTYDEDQLKLAGIDRWVKALREAFETFCAISETKTANLTKVEVGGAKRIREEFISTYNAFVERMNAIAVLMPDEAHDKLASLINTVIAEFKAAEKAEGNKKKDEDKGENKDGGKDDKSENKEGNKDEAGANVETANASETANAPETANDTDGDPSTNDDDNNASEPAAHSTDVPTGSTPA